MVFYFKPRTTLGSDVIVYMGRDKHENEDLIKYGFHEDIWFHVDNLSSAHVYLRLPKGCTMDDIEPDTLEDCAQLVKDNSIKGCKMDSVDVVYTPWGNLRKTKDMEIGQIGFHDQKNVRKLTVIKKNEIVNRLNKTKSDDEKPDFAKERQQYDLELKAERRQAMTAAQKEERRMREEKREKEELRSYKTLFSPATMAEAQEELHAKKDFHEFEDDFM